MKILNCIIFVMAMLNFSCIDKLEYSNCSTFDISNMQDQTYRLTGRPLNFDIDIKRPVGLYSFDSLLILNNMNTDVLLDVYNLNNNKKICSNISYGNGPEELLIIDRIQRIGSQISIFDQMKSKIFTYDICDLLTEQAKPLNIINLSKPATNAIHLPSGNILAISFNEEGKRFSLFSEKGDFIKYIGDYPDYGEDLSIYEKIESFTCQMIMNKNDIVVTNKRTDLIEIYDFEGNLKKREQGPDHFFPAIKQRSSGEEIRFKETKGKSRDAYFHPNKYNNEIWVLYSGKYFDSNNSPIYLNDKIIVFDSNGMPLKQYKLNIPIFSFTINQEKGVLYGITDNPEMQIIEFQLKNSSQDMVFTRFVTEPMECRKLKRDNFDRSVRINRDSRIKQLTGK
ncbi:BF3164 family lipoprotein [Parabacteroides sp.]